MSKRLPFWIYPAHWGLRGTKLAIAKIEFEYEGTEAELKKADVMFLTDYTREEAKLEILKNAKLITDSEFELKTVANKLANSKIQKPEADEESIKIKFKYNLISAKEKDAALIELMPDGEDKVRASLEYVYFYHEITQNEYEKEIATLDGEPWFNFDVEYMDGTVELSFDYNEIFWKKLKEEGHPGSNESEIIDNFIRDWGRKLAADEYGDDYDTKLTRMNETTTGGITDEGLREYK